MNSYNELIKNFNRVREYMREFYVYGFKSREEYRQKSGRTYDNERRRLESWLGKNMHFYPTVDRKSTFISVDTRISRHNPLYKAWKAKTFTVGDITLHFLLFDILPDPTVSLTLNEIAEQMDKMLCDFPNAHVPEVSTLRKKLKEYISEGIIVSKRRGNSVVYRRADDIPELNADVLDFFSEIAPCGVIGSYLLDRVGEHEEHFAFKHHYITGTMDAEIHCTLFQAMREKRGVRIEMMNRAKGIVSDNHVIPLQILSRAQSGRQYLMAYTPHFNRILPYRTDHIVSVQLEEVCENFDALREKLNQMRKNMWGASTQSRSGARMEHVDFTVCYKDDEPFILKRLEREKRCGTLTQIDANHCRFSADVYDSSEMIPWIRTFICRITEIHFSNKLLERQFLDDLNAMYELYGIKDGEKDDLQ